MKLVILKVSHVWNQCVCPGGLDRKCGNKKYMYNTITYCFAPCWLEELLDFDEGEHLR